jgi:hypothetical protein
MPSPESMMQMDDDNEDDDDDDDDREVVGLAVEVACRGTILPWQRGKLY